MDLYEIVRILTDQKKELEKIDINTLCPRREERQFELDSPLAQVVIGVRRSGSSASRRWSSPARSSGTWISMMKIWKAWRGRT